MPLVSGAVEHGGTSNGSSRSGTASPRRNKYTIKCLLPMVIAAGFDVTTLGGSHRTIHRLPPRGIDNECADDLSHNRLSLFMKMTWAADSPSPILLSLLQWLLHPDQNWTTLNWIQQFSTYFRRTSLTLPKNIAVRPPSLLLTLRHIVFIPSIGGSTQLHCYSHGKGGPHSVFNKNISSGHSIHASYRT